MSSLTQPAIKDSIASVDCSDVIATEELLFVISDGGLTQYDLSTGSPVFMSIIETEPVVDAVGR